MRPLGTWFGRLALAGGCLAWAGCGGGSVPDPDSDSNVAPEVSARPVDRGAPQAPAAEAPPPEAVAQAEPAAPTRPEAPAAASNPPAAEAEKPAPSTAAVAPAETEKAAPTVKGDASGTEEMLRIAAAPAPPPGETPGATATPPGGPGAPAMADGPGGSGGPGSGGRDREGSSRGPAGAPGIAETPAGYPGGPAGGPGGSGGPAAPEEPAGRVGIGPRGLAGAADAPGGPGMPGGSGGPGAAAGFTGISGPGGVNNPNGSAPIGPETFKHPATAVQAFLTALQSKNKDRLTQATARRAPTEAEEKHRKIFAEIVDGSISDDELDEMSKAMAGYRVVQILPAKSTGRIGVVIAKAEGRDRLQRTVTVRKEIDGWKVMDIGSMLDFKPVLPPIYMRGGGRRR